MVGVASIQWKGATMLHRHADADLERLEHDPDYTEGLSTVTQARRRPAEVFPPGDFIAEELEARGWTQGDLARILGRPLQAVNAIIRGKKAITPETAVGLGAAFGTSAEIWLNMENSYRLHRAGPPDPD